MHIYLMSIKKIETLPFCNGDVRGVAVIVVRKMDTPTQVQILDMAVCFSLSANTHGKGMKQSVLAPAMCK